MWTERVVPFPPEVFQSMQANGFPCMNIWLHAWCDNMWWVSIQVSSWSLERPTHLSKLRRMLGSFSHWWIAVWCSRQPPNARHFPGLRFVALCVWRANGKVIASVCSTLQYLKSCADANLFDGLRPCKPASTQRPTFVWKESSQSLSFLWFIYSRLGSAVVQQQVVLNHKGLFG